MADSKTTMITKIVQKQAGRAKEKVLQSLGKADKTTDEIFDEYVSNFSRQQSAANRLHKELHNYLRCVRAMQAASKNLFDTLVEMHESEWVGRDVMVIQSQNMDMLWNDFIAKLTDQVIVPLNTYISQFPEVRKRIDKRGRKLTDYDSHRHTLQTLQSNPKKRDEMKIARSKEMLEEARRTYETFNLELHDELPALYDSRIPFYVSNLQTIFTAETVFHSETSKVHSELEAVMEMLAKESQSGKYATKRYPPSSPKGTSYPTASSPETSPTSKSPTRTDQDPRQYEEIDFDKASPNTPTKPVENSVSGPEQDEGYEPVATAQQHQNGDANPVAPKKDGIKGKLEDLYDIPVGATTENLPPGALYQVRATYRYNREDQDELEFDVGEIINVVEYDDPEDQEEGWLMGMKESTGEKGLFPANFTRPI